MDYIDYTSTFGEKLLWWRETNGFSQSDVADILCCTRRTITAWERGEKLPAYDSIIAVAKMMHVTADYLLGMSPLS